MNVNICVFGTIIIRHSPPPIMDMFMVVLPFAPNSTDQSTSLIVINYRQWRSTWPPPQQTLILKKKQCVKHLNCSLNSMAHLEITTLIKKSKIIVCIGLVCTIVTFFFLNLHFIVVVVVHLKGFVSSRHMWSRYQNRARWTH
jgi:hypothetical protein